ncbi:MAG: FAD-dependent oxidoreductase [Bacteroidia bacterium]
MNISFWEKETFAAKSDVLIIGAGLTGLSAAIKLKSDHPKMKVSVLEAGPWPGAASLRNAGFACYGSPSELIDDMQHRPVAEVAELVHRRQRGLRSLRSLLGDEAIGYADCPAWEVFSEGQEELAGYCHAQVAELNALIGMESYSQAGLPAGTHGFPVCHPDCR